MPQTKPATRTPAPPLAAAARVTPLVRLAGLAFLTHGADQMALAGLPLVAVLLFHASPATIGLLVAAQGAAWLVVSLPLGVLIDRASPLRILRGGIALCALGAGLAALAVSGGSLAMLGPASFLLASGTVIFAMAQVAGVPLLVAREGLTAANARLETARALAMLSAPFIVGLCLTHLAPSALYVLAGLSGLAALAVAARLELPEPSTQPQRRPLLASIREGARFVLAEPMLRSIALCAIFWNMAFFALLASFTPFALRFAGFSAGEAGIALGANGAGLLAGAVLARAIMARSAPSLILVGGPILSVAGVLLILFSAHGGSTVAAAGFFLIGFGPMLWLIMQTTLRQIITPQALMGRVTATIQVAIYGSRPLGALAAGLIGAHYGLEQALMFAAGGFGLSLAVVIVSPLARLGALPARA